MRLVQRWKQFATDLRVDVQALYLAFRDPPTPWYAKVLAGLVAAYALSPIDLIPDPVPVLGYLDDLVLPPVGVLIARKLIPVDVLEDCRQQAEERPATMKSSWLVATVIVGIWIFFAAGLLCLVLRNMGGEH
jgi:uncharacterized membrane protein YkvA (DUF1232 family)